MANQKDIENLVKMLDQKSEEGVGRIKIDISEKNAEGQVSEQTHYGRCDIKGECVPEITKNAKKV